MDEAMPRLYEVAAAFQERSRGAVMTEAHKLPRNAVKAQWQAGGLKFYTTEPSEIATAVRAYLDAHWAELVSQARANLR
jgi:hypothetical protein